MDHPSLTLTHLFLALALLSRSLCSPTPAPSPLKHILSEPSGFVLRSPPFSRPRESPKQIFRHRHRPPPLPNPRSGRLNLGKKLGFVFAAIAAVLQVSFAGFLVYKRWQMKKVGRKYRMRVSS